MAFIDNLAYELMAISFSGLVLLYTISQMYLVYRKGGKSFGEHLRNASVPLGILGAYLLVMGIWGQFTWTLPGSYNILFYDPLVSLGILLVAFAVAVRTGAKLEYVGFLGLLVGIMTIMYGIEGYSIGLTQAPLALLAMYFFYGAAGIFSYPVSMIADRLPGLQKRVWYGWTVILVIFWILILVASLLSAFVGLSAVPAHLLSAP